MSLDNLPAGTAEFLLYLATATLVAGLAWYGFRVNQEIRDMMRLISNSPWACGVCALQHKAVTTEADHRPGQVETYSPTLRRYVPEWISDHEYLPAAIVMFPALSVRDQKEVEKYRTGHRAVREDIR